MARPALLLQTGGCGGWLACTWHHASPAAPLCVCACMPEPALRSTPCAQQQQQLLAHSGRPSLTPVPLQVAASVTVDGYAKEDYTLGGDCCTHVVAPAYIIPGGRTISDLKVQAGLAPCLSAFMEAEPRYPCVNALVAHDSHLRVMPAS